MRRLLAATAMVLAAPAAAQAQAQAVRLAAHSEVHALTVSRGYAVAVVDSGDRDDPFTLVRSSGRGRSALSRFGGRNAEFPALATSHGGRAWVTWGVPVSGGARVHVAPVDDLGDALPEVVATGPSWMTFRRGLGAAAVLAYPDQEGNAALVELPIAGTGRSRAPQPRALSTTAPHRRHLPLGVAVGDEGPLVLDLVQQRDRTQLRVIGAAAPPGPILSLPLLRHVPARMAVLGDRIAVGYIRSGRSYLATARLGGSWSRRRLPGSGGEGAPAPMYAHERLTVAYTRRLAGQRDVFLWSGSRARRLTATPGDEREPHAAAGIGEGAAYVAWTRREKTGAKSGFVQRVR